MTTMQTASQCDQSGFVKVCRIRVNPSQGYRNAIELAEIPPLKTQEQKLIFYRIQGFSVDCLVSEGVWTLLIITSLLQISEIQVLSVL